MVQEIMARCGWVDIVLAVFLISGGAVGIKNGLLKEIPKVISVFIAVIITLHYYQLLGEKISVNSFLSQLTAEIIAFSLILLALFIGCRLLLRLFETLINANCARPLEVGGGIVLGMIRYFLVFSLVSYGLLLIPNMFIQDSYFVQSYSGAFVAGVCENIHDFVFNLITSKVNY